MSWKWVRVDSQLYTLQASTSTKQTSSSQCMTVNTHKTAMLHQTVKEVTFTMDLPALIISIIVEAYDFISCLLTDMNTTHLR